MRAASKTSCLSTDGAWVASAGIDKSVHVWSIDGELAHQVFTATARRSKPSRSPRAASWCRAPKMTPRRIWQLGTPAAPPRGPALRAWLEAQTNLTVRRR